MGKMRFPIGLKFPVIFLRLSSIGIILALVAVFGSDQLIKKSSSSHIFSSLEDLPANHVALVLGCSHKLPNGRENLYFRYRIQAAAELFHAGKCNYLLVSGDNGSRNYDEPTDMKSALMALSVPEERIVLDYAGFRTLDSVERASTVFGQRRFTVVSQRFHNERAIYLAQSKGLTTFAYNAKDVASFAGFRTRIREKLARVKTVMDVHLWNTRPKFAGPEIKIPAL